MPNFELKAHLPNPHAAETVLLSLGMELVGDGYQRDTYFSTSEGRLKFREGPTPRNTLIAYQRSDIAQPRESDFQLAEVLGESTVLLDILAECLGIDSIVEKHRRTYKKDNVLVNIDTLLQSYHFVEIEVFFQNSAEKWEAELTARGYKSALAIETWDIVGQSYQHLAPTLSTAITWRQKLGSDLGRLVLIDGPSGAGKTSLVSELATRLPGVGYVRRTTSRPLRGSDAPDEYEYVTVAAFEEAKSRGEFLERREFLFNMQYGLRWNNVFQALSDSRVGLGIMNLGNIRYVTATTPEVVTVLVTAPLPDLKRRIESRQSHSPEAVEERLHNAAIAEAHSSYYDYVLVNRDGEFESTKRNLEEILNTVGL